ncbi:peptide ABC transporter permease [candidate division KSB3 bacterium]|uniref:Peptide ABC transporter permease n=1 Tax=candidate division KSB3 bacterium TaxID=2044937 RepID=A0A2G6E2C5_9BACT|nr:MAG: peptide ABC transporter permease [candidate division KSB3 bacterium]PIE28656.1 MAG: peptide ABC transporter permease [candidate division KSB3 bacterium]
MNAYKDRLWYFTLRQFLRHRPAVAGLGIMVIMTLSVVCANVIMPFDPEEPDLFNMVANPGWPHVMGTDELGRDLLTRTLYGGRVSLVVGVFAMLIAVVLGTLIGSFSGYFGGIVDSVLMRFTDFALAFPRIFVLILLAVLLRPGIPTVVLVIGLLAWMPVARLVRGSFLEIRHRQYIDAARVIGAGTGRIMFRHILPNALGPIIVAASLGVADAIISESGLSFLGLGIQPPTATWGNMLKNAMDQIFDAPWTAIVPGFMIFLTVLSINYIGDGLRDAFDPRKIEQKHGEHAS